jgi:hypothetical protein
MQSCATDDRIAQSLIGISPEGAWSDSEADRRSTGVQALVPRRDGEICGTECQRTGEMDGVSAAELMSCCKRTGSSFDLGGQLDGTHRGPEVLPVGGGRRCLRLGQDGIAAGRCERCADFGIGQSTRQRGITGIPQGRSGVGPVLVEHEFDERARIEIDEGHIQRRCSPTMSATGRFGVGRGRSPATGRVDFVGRLMTP